MHETASPRAPPPSPAVKSRRRSSRRLAAALGPLSVSVPSGVGTYRLSFAPSAAVPFETRLAGLTLKGGRLTVP